MIEQVLNSMIDDFNEFCLLESVQSCNELAFHHYGKTFLLEKSGYLFLFQPYLPLLVTDKSLGFVDSYYLAYQNLYRRRNIALDYVKKQFPSAVIYRGFYKNLMTCLEIGQVMRSTLIWIKPFGTFFCVEVIDLFHRLPDLRTPSSYCFRSECKSCRICQMKCPSGAICDDGFVRSKCLRQWQTGFADLENTHQRKLLENRILGCNLCQIHCPLNNHVTKHVLEPDAKYKSMFQLDSFAVKTCLPGFKESEYVNVFGRNYAKPMKALSFVLNAMLNDEPNSHIETVQHCLGLKNPNARPMLEKYLNICQWEGIL